VTTRLQKLLAHAGIASRRSAERLIAEGRVTVNGQRVTQLGTRVDPQRDAVKVDGRRLPPPPAVHTYLILNKPRGYVTTLSDPEGRPTVRDLLKGVRTRVYPVGRLDYHSEGLLLLTDDGDLARDLLHPTRGVTRTYLVKVHGTPSAEAIERLQEGVRFEGRRTLPARIRVVRPGSNAWVEVELTEGRKHQVRKMLERVGHRVMRLRRVEHGGVRLGDLASGRYRHLTPGEVDRLRRSTGSRTARTAPRRKRPDRS
jgi:23S rRNA pseudouridine2605 synthase